ncbi:MAG TPA: putative peptidoglycan glycosyltransferase FtsW [Candidatus Saccharimonadales bacterium]|nr:putative peptidoglycan glycosyltransferase FtsW [Candidatus Saccharimonadales bacterium]
MNARPRRSPIESAVAGARRHKPDHWLLVLSCLLVTIGLVVVYSISPGLAANQHVSQSYFITKQLIAVALGIVGFGIAAHLPISFWRQHAKTLSLIAIIGCAIVMVTPINANYPAHRWIRLGGFSFQVAELIKLALLVQLAAFLTTQWRRGLLNDFKRTIRPLLILLLILAAVVAKLQSDLGSAGVMIVMIGAAAFSVGLPLKKIAMFSGIVLVILILAIASSGYRRERLATYLHPGSNCQGSGYQECQALISVGSGGVLGLGLGNSVQAYGYLPEPANDSIFAIMAEKFGFIGSFLIIVIYGGLITRLKKIIERTADPFSRLMVVGVLAWFSTQMIINVGAMVGLLPLKGITLPLISQGSTSLVFLAAALGIVFQVSRYTSYRVIEPDINPDEAPISSGSFDGRRVRRPHNPSLVTRPRT